MILKNNKAFSMTEMMIGVGLVTIVNLILGSMVFNLQKQQQRITQKADNISTLNFVQSIVLKSELCNCQIKDKIFNSNHADSVVPLNEIKAGCLATSPTLLTTSVASPGMINLSQAVSGIYLTQLTTTGNSNEYNAVLKIIPFSNQQQMTLRPVSLFMRINTEAGSPSSAKVIRGCGPAPLSVPPNLRAQTGEKSCTIDWGESGGAKPIRYTVQMSETQNRAAVNGAVVCGPESASRSCIVENLVDGRPYYFVVQAINDYEKTAFSSEVTCTPYTIPSEPKNLLGLPGRESCKISWDASEKGTEPISYKIYQSETINESESGGVVCTTSGLNCMVTGLVGGKTYYYSARATNAGGSSPFSAPELSCRAVLKPTKPTNVTTKAGDTICDLNWEKSDEGDPTIKYTGYYSETSDVVRTGRVISGCSKLESDFSCVSEDLQNDRIYYYIVKAENEGGEAYSDVVQCKPGEAPGEISLNVTAKDAACEFTWAKPTGADPMEYTIEMSESGDPFDAADSVAKCDEISTENCTVTGLSNDRVYSFAGIAWNEFGDSSESSVVKCTPVALPNCSYDGVVVAHNATVTAYQEAAPLSSCVSESRVCTDGVLSGTYKYSTCTVDTADPLVEERNNE